MKKFAMLAALSALILAAPAYADTSDTVSDTKAVVKDNVAQSQDAATLAKDRAQKAKDKATGNWSGQAVDSLAIAKDHIVGTEKSGETSADQTIKNQDTK